MKAQILILLLAVSLTACGSAATNGNANNSNSKNSNTTSASNSSETNSNSDVAKDMTPLDLSPADMAYGEGDKEKVGRMVTVKGGLLEKVSYNSLLIRDPGGRAFTCNGDFSEYTKMADKVESLAAQGKAPKATVKGVYKIASVGTGGELSPCVLADLEK